MVKREGGEGGVGDVVGGGVACSGVWKGGCG